MAKSNLGKLVGGGIGWAFGGPIGAIVGVVLGSLVDTAGESEPVSNEPNYQRGNPSSAGGPNDFFMSMLVLSAAIMKADGRHLKSELNYIKSFLLRNFGEAKALEALPILKKMLDTPIGVRQVCLQIRQHVDHSGRLQLMHYLFGIATSDGQVDAMEESLLHQIAGYFSISEADLASLKAMYVKSVNSSYTILEVAPDASDEEVKKAYRRMATRFHPDKVSSLGEEAVNAAKIKFQKLQEAYDEIRKLRGMK